jgi:hypothetical protein
MNSVPNEHQEHLAMPSSDNSISLGDSSTTTRVNSRAGHNQERHTAGSAEKGSRGNIQNLPIPLTGFHELGVAFEDVTVYGSDASRREVESFEVSALRAFDLYGLVKKIFGIKTGASRALISK